MNKLKHIIWLAMCCLFVTACIPRKPSNKMGWPYDYREPKKEDLQREKPHTGNLPTNEGTTCASRGFSLITQRYTFMPRSTISGSSRIMRQRTPMQAEEYAKHEAKKRGTNQIDPKDLERVGSETAYLPIFEADANIIVPIFSLRLKGYEDPVCGSSHTLTLLPSVGINLRMMSFGSAPVIPPSYKPSIITLQYLYKTASVKTATYVQKEKLERKNTIPTPGIFERKLPKVVWTWGATLRLWEHHSNGQEGDLFFPDSGCRANNLKACEDPRQINQYDGSFSTNYLALSGHVQREWAFNVYDGQPAQTFRFSAQFQAHPVGYFGVGYLTEEQSRLWGTWRTNFEAEYEYRWPKNANRAYARLFGEIGNPHEDVDIGLVQLEAGWFNNNSVAPGLFIRGSYGQDYYNLLFVNTVKRLEIGLVLDTGTLMPQYKAKPMKPSTLK